MIIYARFQFGLGHPTYCENLENLSGIWPDFCNISYAKNMRTAKARWDFLDVKACLMIANHLVMTDKLLKAALNSNKRKSISC